MTPLIRIHGAIADSGLWPEKNLKGQVLHHDAIKLWYWLRSQDPLGSGWAEIKLLEVAETFDRSRYTITRWINWGLQLGFFRARVRLGVKHFRIYYSSAISICANRGISTLGAIAQVEVDRLKNLKFAATEAEALKLQAQSRYTEVNRHNHESVKAKVIDPVRVLTSDLGKGATLTRKGRFTFLKSSALPIGGSQKGIASRMGRHADTVQRRLADQYRANHGLDPVLKTQLVARPLTEHDAPPSGVPTKVSFRPGQRIIRTREGVFRLTNNIYGLDNVFVESVRYKRYALNRAIAKIAIAEELDQSWKLSPEHLAHKAAFRQSQAYKQRLSLEKSTAAGVYLDGNEL